MYRDQGWEIGERGEGEGGEGEGEGERERSMMERRE
jgi:hypothetical protein